MSLTCHCCYNTLAISNLAYTHTSRIAWSKGNPAFMEGIMPPGPEDTAREQIDRMLIQSGWTIQDAKAVILYAKQGVAIREFEVKS